MRPDNDRDGPATTTCIDLDQEQLNRLSDPAYLLEKIRELSARIRYWFDSLEDNEEVSIVFEAFQSTRTRILSKGAVRNLDGYLHDSIRYMSYARNRKASRRRKLFKKREHDLACRSVVLCPTAGLSCREFWKRIARELRSLPKPQQQAFRWCMVKDRSQRALERKHGWYQGRAHRECQRAIETLQVQLADYCPHAEALPLTRNIRFDP